MAKGDKLPVVMGREKAAPGGVATLGDDGVLEEAQRPKITAGDNITLKQEGSALEIGAVVPGKIMFINWDFRKPVNRNGVTQSVDGGYGIDLWNGVYTIKNGFIHLNGGFMGQHLEDYPLNAALTFSALLLDGTLLSGSQVLHDKTSQILFASHPEYGNNIQLIRYEDGRFMIWTAAGYEADIIAAVLEEGDHQTHFRQNADGDWEIIDPPDYDLQYLLCSQYSPSTGEWVGSQHSNENLLDNSRLDINQRELSEYTNYGYTVDRWALGGNAKNGKYTAASKTLSCNATTTAFIYLEQKIESPSRFAGKTLTLSALFGSANRAIVQIWRSNSSGTVALAASGTWGNDLFQFCSAKIPNDVSDSDYIRIIVQTQNSIQIKATKLELGPVPTLAHKDGDTWVLNDPPPNIALELLKCQRYYVAFEDNAFATGSEVAIYANARFALSGTKFPVKMRAVPTITIKDVRVWSGEQYEVGNVSAFGVNAAGFTGIDSSTMKFSANHIAYYFHYTADADL